jgi:hypothetical protein
MPAQRSSRSSGNILFFCSPDPKSTKSRTSAMVESRLAIGDPFAVHLFLPSGKKTGDTHGLKQIMALKASHPTPPTA